MARWLAAFFLLLRCATPAPACSLCANPLKTPTFREEASQSYTKAIVFGTLENPRITSGDKGVTDLRIEAVLRDHPVLAGKKVVELERYIPVDPKDPPRFLIFCDVFKDKLDAYRGVPIKSKAALEYFKGAVTLDAKDRVRLLLYFSHYLEHPDKDVAQDAFLEFAKAGDTDIGQVAGKLPAEKLRHWVQDSEVPASRLGLYAILLGFCGQADDASLLRSMLKQPNERTSAAYDGILGGYVLLQPQEGWELAYAILRDEKSFTLRMSVIRMMRFLQGYRPDQYQAKVVHGLEALLTRSDMADFAMEDLRRWQIWDLTAQVLALYKQKDFEAPLIRRAVLRYALSCPRPEAGQFLTEARTRDAALLKEVEESLQYERRPAK